jgi:tRNA(Arg) A34 adenosine deaminase TadA
MHGLLDAVGDCPDHSVLEAIVAMPTSAIISFIVPRPALPTHAVARPGTAAMHSYWMRVARRLTTEVHWLAIRNVRPRTGHNIGAILVDANNHILAWGVNTNTHNATRHAETKCIWMYQRLYPGQKLPQHSTLYTTLQSCLMCSGTIKHAAADHTVRVIYGEADKVRNSALTRAGGAVEMSLDSLIPRNSPLAMRRGHHMLALGRWDRVRQTLARKGAARTVLRGAPADNDLDLLRGVVRSRAEAARSSDEQLTTLQAAYDQQDSDRRTLGPKIRQRQGAIERELWDSAPVARLRLRLERHQRELRDLQDFAIRSPTARQRGFGSGAPILLQNADALRVLDATLSELPRPDSERSVEQALLDVQTMLYAVSFIQTVLPIARQYAES